MVPLLVGLASKCVIALLMVVAWLDRSFAVKLPFPRDPDELVERQAWCIAQLRGAQGVPENAEITGFEVVPIKQGEAFRSQIARVTVTWTAGAVRGTLKVIAKFAPKATSLRDFAVFMAQENHVKEVGVYQEIAAFAEVAAPHCWYAGVDRGRGQLCLLIEDLSHCIEITEVDGCPAELAEQAVVAMAEMHARFWQAPGPTAAFAKPIPDPLIDWFASLLTGDDAVFAEVLRQVWRRDKQAPTTFVHGDARVGNLLFGRDDGSSRFAFIDWQAARPGKGVFDVAYFMVLSCAPTVRVEHLDRLLQRYHATLVAGGVRDYSREMLDEDYRYAVLMVLSFVTLPFLSAESSATDANEAGLMSLGRVWTERMVAVVEELDVEWIAGWSGLSEADLRDGFAKSNARAKELV